MMRSLYSGVSGLRNHQTRMDVIGNNIANVNTTGYKTSRTIFQDIYSQTLSTASVGGTNLGGTNPTQVGLGVRLATIDNIFTSGATQITDNPSDLAIEGDGFFIVSIGNIDSSGKWTSSAEYYTRAGNFYIDNAGNFVTSDGYYVQGYDLTGSSPATDITNINLADYTNISIDEEGVIWGIDTGSGSDVKVAVAQVAMAMFTNNPGLEKVGGSLYRSTGNSGAATYTVSGSKGAGKINPGGLEMSNVDLAAEFTDMIITQRGFQANSRVITTSDSMLEELVNLKR